MLLLFYYRPYKALKSPINKTLDVSTKLYLLNYVYIYIEYTVII